MLSKDDEDSLRAWADNHVVVGTVQARQVLALLTELNDLRKQLAEQRRPEQAVAGDAT